MSGPGDSTPRRFIAGARCSACQSLDRVVVYREGGNQYRACVACGFQEVMHFETGFSELETRVNRQPDGNHEVAVVRLVGPGTPES